MRQYRKLTIALKANPISHVHANKISRHVAIMTMTLCPPANDL